MKLQTSIKPRRNGVVLVTGLDQVQYTFAPAESAELECDIAHEPTIKHLLATQNFYPASEQDFQQALQLAQTAAVPGDLGAPGGEPNLASLSAKADADLDEPDDEGDLDALPLEGIAALPVEANTPPQTAPDRAARKNGALQAAAKATRK
jgi:hypothetical protein